LPKPPKFSRPLQGEEGGHRSSRYRKITGNEATAIDSWRQRSWQEDNCSTVLIQSRRRRTFCTSWRAIKTWREDVSGGRRNCRGVRGDWRQLCRPRGIDRNFRPGIALKQEAIGLAVMTELPLVIINVQRGGIDRLATKTEQADLFQAVWDAMANARQL